MATTPAEYLIEIAAVTDRDRCLITHRDVMVETGDKIAALTDAARALGGAGVRFAVANGSRGANVRD